MTKQVKFTERQRAIVALIAQGATFEQMGERLGIAARTAKAHSDAVRVKLGVEKRRMIPLAYLTLTGESPLTIDVPQMVAA